MNPSPTVPDPAKLLAAFNETDNFCIVPRSALQAGMKPREAIAFTWFRFRAGGDWLTIKMSDLAAGIGLSPDQMTRALDALIELGVVEAERPGMSRLRRYRVAQPQTQKCVIESAEPRLPNAESRLGTSLSKEVLSSNEHAADGVTPPKSKLDPIAKAIVDDWWERHKADTGHQPTAQNYIGVVKIVAKVLAAGHRPEAIRAALPRVPTVSVGTLEMILNGRPSSGRPSTDEQWDGLARVHAEFLAEEAQDAAQ